VLSRAFGVRGRVFLADRGAPRLFWGDISRVIPLSFARKPPRPRPPVAREESGGDQASTVSVAVLRELQALHGTGDEILDALVPRARLLLLEGGRQLLRRGEQNLRVYVVISGRLRVELDGGGSPLAHIIRGETVGELSLLAGSAATATVVAEEPTQLLVLNEETFWWLAESSHEFSVGLLVRLAKRLRSNNEAVQENIALRLQFEQAALNDALTGFRNRRWLDQTLPRILQRHVHAAEPLCIAMMDIDHFKRVNDSFGHAAGDAVLLQVGRIVRGNLRPSDFAARIGGEEFALVFPQTDLPGAIHAAERLREAIAGAVFKHHGRKLPQMTVSLGLVALERSADPLKLLAQADVALYAAKQAGRNRTEWPRRVASGEKARRAPARRAGTKSAGSRSRR
jgi:diguanylate cyclase (GGDEF)-like protein